MMGLHQNYPVSWGPERMEGLTLDLGLEMFSPLPTELIATTKESESCWSYFESPKPLQVHGSADFLSSASMSARSGDASVLLTSNRSPRKSADIFQAVSRYPSVQMKVEHDDLTSNQVMVVPGLATDLISPDNAVSQSELRVELSGQSTLQCRGADSHSALVSEMSGDISSRACNYAEPELKSGSLLSAVAFSELQPSTSFLEELDSDGDSFLDIEEDGMDIAVSAEGCSQVAAYNTCLQGLPLHHIKRHLRSINADEHDWESLPRTFRAGSFGSQDFGAYQGTQASDEMKKGAKRARYDVGHEQISSPHMAMKDETRVQSSTHFLDVGGIFVQIMPDTAQHEQMRKPLIDVNEAIPQMPQDTADAFEELFRLVEVSDSESPMLATGIDHSSSDSDSVRSCQLDDPQPTGLDYSVMSRAGLERGNPKQHKSVNPSVFPRVVTESVSRQPASANASVFSRVVPEPFNAQTPSANAPAVVRVGPESRSEDLCSLQPVHYEQHVDKRPSNAHIVVFEPKPEPFTTEMENTVGSVVQVKQEVEQYPNPTDIVSCRPVEGNAVGPCLVSRKIIQTALNTFEICRRQIIKDPTYGSRDGLKCSNNTRRLRADLKAACLMRKKGFWLNEKIRPIGEVPGVAVGDCFRYRIEMAVIGLHRAVQAGIAVVPAEHSKFGVSVASSVVIGVADPYGDDRDMGETVVYSGQGGLSGKTKESQDQELKRGNLALSYSFKFRLPVRLIRGHKDQNSVAGLFYSYDGLYQIVDMNYVTGVNGKKVYKFTMHRLPGQLPISCFANPSPLGSKPPCSSQLPPNGMCWTPPDVKPLYLEK